MSQTFSSSEGSYFCVEPRKLLIKLLFEFILVLILVMPVPLSANVAVYCKLKQNDFNIYDV